MNIQTINISGTHCGACKKLIEKRISAISGVNLVNVDFETGETKIKSKNKISNEQIKTALEGTDYEQKD